MGDDVRTRLQALCHEILKLVGLRQGHVEIHCYEGRPKKMDVIDKSIKFDETQESRRA